MDGRGGCKNFCFAGVSRQIFKSINSLFEIDDRVFDRSEGVSNQSLSFSMELFFCGDFGVSQNSF